MNALSIKRALTEFAQVLWRNRWVSLGTVIAMSMVFFLTWLVFAVTDSSGLLIDHAEEKVDIGVFFQKDASPFQIEAFQNELKELQTEKKIKGFEYFSEEYALEEMKKKFPEKVRFLERYQFENPLQASVEIVPGEWGPDKIFSFLQEERLDSLIDRSFFSRYEEKKEEVSRILRLLAFFRQGGFILALIFLAICAFLIGFFISSILQQKKREIFIMRLVGAAHAFIRLPFILEGVTLSLVGFLVSFFMFAVFLESVAPLTINFFAASSADQVFIGELIAEIQQDFSGGFWANLLMLLVLSGGIAFFTVERFVRKRHLLGEE